MNTTTKSKQSDTIDALADRLEQLRTFDTRLWAGSPEVQAARARVRNLTPALTALTTGLAPGQDVRGVVSAALQAALDGEPIDADQLRSDVARSIAAVQTAEAVRSAVAEASHDVRRAAATAEPDHAPEALAVLHATLVELVDIGRTLIPLTTITGSLADAGRAGQARALLEVAVEIHDRLRDMQMTLTRTDAVDGPTLARSFGIVTDVSSLQPWASQLAHGDTAWTQAPKLDDLVYAGGEPLFRLVCRTDLEPWVPTVEQMLRAKAAMTARVEQARYDALHPDADATTIDEGTGFRLTVDGHEPPKRITSRSLHGRRSA